MKLPLAATFLLASSAISAIGSVGAFLVPTPPPPSSLSAPSTTARRTTTTKTKTTATATATATFVAPLFRSSTHLAMSAVEEATEKKGEEKGETFE